MRGMAMALAAAVFCGVAPVRADNGVMKDGWLVLFDGEEMNGWAHTGGGTFRLDTKGKFMETVGKTGVAFYYDQKFKDFVLHLEWRTTHRNSNSGVFVRFPNLPKIKFEGDKKVNGYWMAVNEGYEVQVYDDGPPEHRTGTIIPGGDCHEKSWRDVGEWNEMDITCKGQNYTVNVNGKVINEFTGDRALEGYVGVQNHDLDKFTHYRNIRVKELK